MQNFFSQNRNVILVAIGVFVVSMTGLLMFFNAGSGYKEPSGADLKTDVIGSEINAASAENAGTAGTAGMTESDEESGAMNEDATPVEEPAAVNEEANSVNEPAAINEDTTPAITKNSAQQPEVADDSSADSFSGSSADSSADSPYKNQFNENEDTFVIVSPDGTLNHISAGFEKSTGYKADELKSRTYFSLVNPSDLPVILEAFGKTLESGESVTMVGPYRILDKQGTYKINMGSFYPFKKEEVITSIGIVNRDISEAVEAVNKPAPAYKAPTSKAPAYKAPVSKAQTAKKDSEQNKTTIPDRDSKWIMSYKPSF